MQLNLSWSIHAEKYKIATTTHRRNNVSLLLLSSHTTPHSHPRDSKIDSTTYSVINVRLFYQYSLWCYTTKEMPREIIQWWIGLLLARATTGPLDPENCLYTTCGACGRRQWIEDLKNRDSDWTAAAFAVTITKEEKVVLRIITKYYYMQSDVTLVDT